MDRDGSGSDRRRSNRTDAVAGSFVLWPGEKGGETHTAAGRVCLPPVVGDGWLGEPLGVGHFDSFGRREVFTYLCASVLALRAVLAPTVALRVFLVRLVRRVVCGDAVRGRRPVQCDRLPPLGSRALKGGVGAPFRPGGYWFRRLRSSAVRERSAAITRATSRVLAVKLLPELALCDTSRSKNATGEAPWPSKGNSDRQGSV